MNERNRPKIQKAFFNSKSGSKKIRLIRQIRVPILSIPKYVQMGLEFVQLFRLQEFE
jgi:hypothetical protein